MPHSSDQIAMPPPAGALPHALVTLIEGLEQEDVHGVSSAVHQLAELDIAASDLAPWFDFSHPVQDSYGRQAVRIGANYELMVMTWLPGDYSAIHDHGGAEWGAVRYFGPAEHILFSIWDGQLAQTKRMTMAVGDVCAVDQTLIHLMGNPTNKPFVSLHLYGRDRPSDCITGGARIFDLFEQRIQRTDGGVFFCLPESDICRREPCPPAETATEQLHHQLMLARLNRIAAVQELSPALAERGSCLERRLQEGEVRANIGDVR